MSRIEEEKQEPMAAEPLPLGKNWWLSFYSRPSDHPAFDYIHVEISLSDFSKEITKIHVPKIDGLVCESHSIIGHLINQNTKALLSEVEAKSHAIEALKENTIYLSAKLKRQDEMIDECLIGLDIIKNVYLGEEFDADAMRAWSRNTLTKLKKLRESE